MAASHKGAISFGLVHIPVALHTATQDNDIHFNQLCRDDLSRVRYKKTCASCGKEVASKDIVKGFEYDKDKYVVINDEEFEKIKTDKDRSIQILHFADLSSIPPIYYDKTYHAVPDAGSEKAFQLLRTAMLDQHKVAIAKTVMGNKDTLLSIIPTEEGMLIETMFFEDEVKAVPKEVRNYTVDENELGLAKQLISAMDKPFDPKLYHDEYQERLRQLIQTKIAGQEIVQPAGEPSGNIINLMDALRESLKKSEEMQRKSS